MGKGGGKETSEKIIEKDYSENQMQQSKELKDMEFRRPLHLAFHPPHRRAQGLFSHVIQTINQYLFALTIASVFT